MTFGGRCDSNVIPKNANEQNLTSQGNILERWKFAD